MPEAARRADVTVQEVGGDTILTDPIAGRTHVINATAAWIWARLDGSTSTAQIATELAGAFSVEPERALNDVERITASFDSLGLLSR